MPSLLSSPLPFWFLCLATVLFAIVTVIWVYLAPREGRGWGILALGLAAAALIGLLYVKWIFPTLEQIMKLVGGLVALGVVIYATYAITQSVSAALGGWSDAWTYVGYVLAALAALVLLAVVWIQFGALLQAQTGLLGVVVQLIFALPCLVAWLAQYVTNDFRGTAPATLLLLAAETVLIGAFVFRGPLQRAGRAVASWILPAGLLAAPSDRVTTRLQTDRVFLNYETRLGNRPLPEDNGAPETRAKSMLTPARSLGQNQDYRVTFEVYLHALDLGAGAAFPVLRYAEGGSSGGSGRGGCPSVYFEGAGTPGAGGGSIWVPSSGAEGFHPFKKQKKFMGAAIKKASVKVAAGAGAGRVVAGRVAAGAGAGAAAAAAAAAVRAGKKKHSSDADDEKKKNHDGKKKKRRTNDVVAAAKEEEEEEEEEAPQMKNNQEEEEDVYVPNVLASDNQRNSAQLRVYLTNTGSDDAVLISVPLQRWVELAFYYTRTQVDVFVDRRLIHSLPWRTDNRPAFGSGDQFVVGSPVPNGAALGSLRNLAVETPYPLIRRHTIDPIGEAEEAAALKAEEDAAARSQVQKNSAE